MKHGRFNGIYSAKGRERKRTVREHRSHALGPRLSRTLSSPSRSPSHQYLSPFAISMATDAMTRRRGHRHFCFAVLLNFALSKRSLRFPQPALAAIRPQKANRVVCCGRGYLEGCLSDRITMLDGKSGGLSWSNRGNSTRLIVFERSGTLKWHKVPRRQASVLLALLPLNKPALESQEP